MNTHPDPEQTVSQLGQSLTQSAESGRALIQEMTVFAKDESLRFASLRLERNGAALDKLQHCQGIPGLIGVQQEWLRDFLQDYTSQSMRFMGTLRGLTRNVMEKATENAADTIDRMQHEAGDAMHQAETAMDQAGQQINQMVQDTNGYVQPMQH
jgi:ElaB/YqjD/DUF883 family membrane-anchored ribosome-binding protein